MSILSILFPYRTHLESEIEYLKEQLAQSRRRVDELQDILAVKVLPRPSQQAERKPAGKMVTPQPKGWDAYREFKRSHPEEAGDEQSENKVDKP